MTAPDPDLPGSEVVYRRAKAVRRRWQGRAIAALIAAAALAAAAVLLGTPALVLAAVLGLVALGCAGSYLLEGAFRTILTPEAIIVRRYRQRVIPWSKVAAFRIRGQADGSAFFADPGNEADAAPRRPIAGGGPWQTPVWSGQSDRRTERPGRTSIVVVLTSGRTVRLPAPLVAGELGDAAFADDARQLEQWRLRYAGFMPSAINR